MNNSKSAITIRTILKILAPIFDYLIDRVPSLSLVVGYRRLSQPALRKLCSTGEVRATEVLPAEVVIRNLPKNIQYPSELPAGDFFGRSFRGALREQIGRCSVCEVRRTLVTTRVDEWGNHFFSVLGSGPRVLPIRGTGFGRLEGEMLRNQCFVEAIDAGAWFLECWATNHFHWLTMMLPKALLLSREFPSFPLLVPTALLRDEVKRASLRAIGVESSAIRELAEGITRVGRMGFVDATASDGRLLRQVRAQVLSTVLGCPIVATRMVYISRAKAKWRRLLNEEAVVQMLVGNGFEIVCCESMSFDEQVRLFAESKFIIGAHGAGLANIIFSSDGAKILEIAHPGWPNPDYFLLSNNLGHTYFLVKGEAAGVRSPAYDDFHIDLVDLRSALDVLLGRS